MLDPSALTHGLPPCLRVPIAAATVDAINTFVGHVLRTIEARYRSGNQRVGAVLVWPYDHPIDRHPHVKLWQEPMAAEYERRLFLEQQVWVHVDYGGYRQAYQRLGLTIPERTAEGIPYFLDHVQNRQAVRLRCEIRREARTRGYPDVGQCHAYLRLCPVRATVNTDGGVDQGGEGLERAYLKEALERLKAGDLPKGRVEILLRAFRGQIVYADPMDLTKMLDRLPGLHVLDGVRDTQALYFP